MSALFNKNEKVVAQQGEVKVLKLDGIPEGFGPSSSVERNKNGDWILSHSEKGSHHVIDGDIELLERTENVPTGMKMLIGIVKSPGKQLRQLATNGHQDVSLAPGDTSADETYYGFRIGREYNPFLEEARQIKD